MSETAAKLDFSHDGRVARLILARPKANILDEAMVTSLCGHLETLSGRQDLRAVVLEAEGPHFCFGASVQEHLPEQIGGALERLRTLLVMMIEAPAPTIAAIRGQCLGGGLELVLSCDLILAEETAMLGCPEIKLAVFPPAAAAMLPPRIGAGPAAQLALTGASVNGADASVLNLVARAAPADELYDVLNAWLEDDFLPRSPAALRHAVRATRRPLLKAVLEELPVLERLYLDDLMAEADAVEGINAFLEKRSPSWEADGDSGDGDGGDA